MGISAVIAVVILALIIWGIVSIVKSQNSSTESFQLIDSREVSIGCLPPGGLIDRETPGKVCCSGSYAFCDGEECVCA